MLSNKPSDTISFQRPGIIEAFCSSILVGFLFGLIVLIGCVSLTVVETVRFGYWDFDWIGDRGHVPIITMFGISSASYFVSRVFPARFAITLLLISLCTMFVLFGLHGFGFFDFSYGKQSPPYWLFEQEQLFFASLGSPWAFALLVVALQRGFERLRYKSNCP